MSRGAGTRVTSVVRSHRGRVRDRNEDAALARGPLLAVADGMGGHVDGHVASAMVIAALDDLGPDPEPAALAAALRRANESIRAAARDAPDGSGMGTTCTTILVAGDSAHVAHIGDSRAYLFRDGDLRQLTEDHALVAQLVRAGLLTEEQASRDERRNVVLRALGPSADPEVDAFAVPIRAGDRLLVSSDGLHGYVDHDAIAAALGGTGDVEAAAEALVALALDAGAPDNVTVAVAQIAEIPPEAADVANDPASEARVPASSRPSRRGPRAVIVAGVLVAVIVAIALAAVGLSRPGAQADPPGTPVASGPAGAPPASGPAKAPPSVLAPPPQSSGGLVGPSIASRS